MIKLKPQDALFCIIQTTLFFFVFIIAFYMNEQEIHNRLSNNLYTKNSVTYVTDDEKMSVELPSYTHRITLEYNSSVSYLINDNTNWIPPMVSGRYFSYTGDVLQAVIGRQANMNMLEYEGRSYVEFEGEHYEIIGIMGVDFPSSIDYKTLLYHPNKVHNYQEKRVVLDTESRFMIDKVKKEFENKNPNLIQMNKLQRGILGISNISFLYWLISLGLYLIAFTVLVVIIYTWVLAQENIVYVYNLIGLSKFSIVKHLFLKINLLIGTAWIIAAFPVGYSDILQSDSAINSLFRNSIVFIPYSWVVMFICSGILLIKINKR